VDSPDERGAVNLVTNIFYENALETALQFRERIGSGKITVLSFGAAAAEDSSRKALAMKADEPGIPTYSARIPCGRQGRVGLSRCNQPVPEGPNVYRTRIRENFEPPEERDIWPTRKDIALLRSESLLSLAT